MNRLIEAALELQTFIQSQAWRFCVIGGLAVLRWGHPGATQDVVVSLFTSFGAEEEFVDRLLARFSGRISDARAFALQNRVVLATAANGVPLDIALAGYPFEEQIIDRATPYEFTPGAQIVTASAEDLIVLKAFASRARDWADIEGIAARQRGKIDWDHVERELEPLCELKAAPEILARVQAIRAQATG